MKKQTKKANEKKKKKPEKLKSITKKIEIPENVGGIKKTTVNARVCGHCGKNTLKTYKTMSYSGMIIRWRRCASCYRVTREEEKYE